jgi:cell division protein ZapA
MDRRTVQLRVAGQSYRVVTTADEAELVRLAAVVDAKLAEMTGPGRSAPPQALLLAAIALAHEAEEARADVARVEERLRSTVARLLERIDAALAEPTPEPPPAVSPPT